MLLLENTRYRIRIHDDSTERLSVKEVKTFWITCSIEINGSIQSTLSKNSSAKTKVIFLLRLKLVYGINESTMSETLSISKPWNGNDELNHLKLLMHDNIFI